jgi:calcineurin-like phosphoesterase family protein
MTLQNKIWVTSDWHFNHNKEFIWGPRGFSSVEEMNENIIEKYNSVVRENDIIYCLGDCGLGGAGQEALNQLKNYIERLNGTIIIVQGNHCTNKRIELYRQCKNVQQVEVATTLKYGKYHFYLSHYPTLTSNWDNDKPLKQRTVNLCGHSHTKNRWQDWDKGPIYHVELDAHANFPVSIEQIIEEMREKE